MTTDKERLAALEQENARLRAALEGLIDATEQFIDFADSSMQEGDDAIYQGEMLEAARKALHNPTEAK